MPLPEIIREEFVMAMLPYARPDIPDSVRFTAYEAAEGILLLANKMKLIDKMPEIEKISYESGRLIVIIDGEEIKIPEEP